MGEGVLMEVDDTAGRSDTPLKLRSTEGKK